MLIVAEGEPCRLQAEGDGALMAAGEGVAPRTPQACLKIAAAPSLVSVVSFHILHIVEIVFVVEWCDGNNGAVA